MLRLYNEVDRLGVHRRPTRELLGAVKKKRFITFTKVDLFVHKRKPQSAGAAYDRKQSFLPPHNVLLRQTFDRLTG